MRDSNVWNILHISVSFLLFGLTCDIINKIRLIKWFLVNYKVNLTSLASEFYEESG